MNNLNEIELNVRDRVQLENLHISTAIQGGGGGGDVVPIEIIYDEEMGIDLLQCTPREMKALVDENKSIMIYSKWGDYDAPNSFWGYDVTIFLGYYKQIAPITGKITYVVGTLSYATGSAKTIAFTSDDLDNKFVYANIT